MKSKAKALAAGALTSVLALGVFVEPASADLAETGKNLGSTVTTWAGALLFGVAGLVGLQAVVKQEVSKVMVILLIVTILGAIIFFPEQIKNLAESLTESL